MFLHMHEFEVLLADSDGTLLDTDRLIRQAFRTTFLHPIGIEIDDIDISAVMGKPLKDCYSLIAAQHGLLINAKEVEQYCVIHDNFQNNNLHLALPFTGTLEVLKEIRAHGVKIAVVTTRTNNGRHMLKEAGITSLVDYIVTGDDVTHHKPDPEGLNKALNHLKAKANRSVYVGDTGVDMLAGQNAGTATIAALYGSLGKEILNYKHDYWIDSVTELPDIVLSKCRKVIY